jgi:N6-adenosine-specific RNA methylase IME4
MMQPDELTDLVDDIKQNGLIEPIVLYEDKILDGRNRYLACGEAGVKPHYEYYKGDEPVGYVISKNVQRRHLNGSQKAMIASDIKPALEVEAEKRRLANLKQYDNTDSELVHTRRGRSDDKAGEMFGVSGRYVSDAEKIRREAPEFVQPIMDGQMTITEAKRKINREEKINKIIEKAAEAESLDEIGIYSIIYADPPWQYEHPISDSRRIENQYPTMSIEDICNLDIQNICADDAVLFLWVSTPMLKKGLQVIDAWGFEYRTSMVWVKPSIGPGHWVRQRHEFLLIAKKGNVPTPKGSDKPDSVIEAPRTEHSKKPDVMYEIIERMYPELPKVELFSRNEREGWKAWGFES